MFDLNPTPQAPLLMGIVNVTPDSFSDGGKFLDADQAVAQGLALQGQGADILDLGAESTRPGADPVSEKEQIRRLAPVVEGLRKQSAVTISIDTQSARVAAACLERGADMVNDVSALRSDRGMAKLVARWKCPVVLMHMKGSPRTMQNNPRYGDVVAAVYKFFESRLAVCEKAGIEHGKIWLDPGIGFGKTVEHNLVLLGRLGELGRLGRPLLIGVSRKSFLGKITGEERPDHRVSASIVAGMLSIARGASVLRVHDVAEHRAALKVWNRMR